MINFAIIYLMVEGLKDKFLKGFTFTLLVLIIGGGLFMAYPSYRRGQALKRQDNELQARIEMKKREIAGLVENQRRFKSDADFVETIARQNRRVFPGELVFIFEDD